MTAALATIDHGARDHSAIDHSAIDHSAIARPLAVTLAGAVDPGLQNTLTVPVEYLHAVFSYAPATGKLFWRISSPRAAAGDEAGSMTKGGRYVQLDGVKYRAARVVWAMHYGEWPVVFIDHIDLNNDNNRLRNLRLASRGQNNMNRSAQSNSIFKGVSYRADSGRWRARITVDGVVYHLGSYATAEETHAAYCAAAPKFHGVYARSA